MLLADFQSALTVGQWAVLALVPLGIVALYFLKLRRQRIEVPSTYLWMRAIEDLHVNSLWQRLRQSLLLLLQLLLVALVALALARPGWRGTHLPGNRFIFLIDCSASMAAEDVPPHRLEAARRQALALIDQMRPGDRGMVLSFSNVAQVEQSFTDNRRLLRAAVQRIVPTARPSDVTEALRAAAGLANPGQSGDPDNPLDLPAAEALPATLYLLSDGGFGPVSDFKLGNLTPVYLKQGSDRPRNVAIAAFSTELNPEKPERVQAFARLEHYGEQPTEVELTLRRDGTLLDVRRVALPPRDANSRVPGVVGVQFDLEAVEAGVLELSLEPADHLALDNTAWAVINPPRPARVLLVTPGSQALVLALQTEELRKVADLTVAEPAFLQTQEYQSQAAAGAYDLVIYDQCVPPKPPECNALWIGCLPPASRPTATPTGAAPALPPRPGEAPAASTSLGEWSAGPPRTLPVLIDARQSHPLTHLVQMEHVLVLEASPLAGPPGMIPLIEADIGPVYAVAPRGSYEDAVLGWPLVTFRDGQGQANTNWVRRPSFPVFVFNAVRYLGGVRTSLAAPSVLPGSPVTLRLAGPAESISVQTPAGQRWTVPAERSGSFVFTQTDQLGVYQVRAGSGPQVRQRFAVNLFDSRESDLTPADQVALGYEQVPAQGGTASQRRELWRYLVLAALAVLLAEWYVYNRRVYF